jgi:hypothetical protein
MRLKIVWNAAEHEKFVDHTGTRRDRFQWVGRARDQRYEVTRAPDGDRGYILKHYVREATGDWGLRVGDYTNLALAKKAAQADIQPVREITATHLGTGIEAYCLQIGGRVYSDRGMLLSERWVPVLTSRLWARITSGGLWLVTRSK